MQASYQGETGEGVKKGLPGVASGWLRKCRISENGGYALLLPSRGPVPRLGGTQKEASVDNSFAIVFWFGVPLEGFLAGGWEGAREQQISTSL